MPRITALCVPKKSARGTKKNKKKKKPDTGLVAPKIKEKMWRTTAYPKGASVRKVGPGFNSALTREALRRRIKSDNKTKKQTTAVIRLPSVHKQ